MYRSEIMYEFPSFSGAWAMFFEAKITDNQPFLVLTFSTFVDWDSSIHFRSQPTDTFSYIKRDSQLKFSVGHHRFRMRYVIVVGFLYVCWKMSISISPFDCIRVWQLVTWNWKINIHHFDILMLTRPNPSTQTFKQNINENCGSRNFHSFKAIQ